MDGQRFDNVARLIGTGASRRRVIKGLAAGLFGLGGASFVRSEVGAQQTQGECIFAGNSCANEEVPCCSGLVCAGVPPICADPESCSEENGPCNTDTGPGCCKGLTCSVTQGSNGTCVPEEPPCAGSGESCNTTDDCCDILSCVDNICTEVHSCETDADCVTPAGPGLGEICCEGICVAVECCGVGDDAHCGEDDLCNENQICEPPPSDECEVDTDCIQPLGVAQPLPICCGGVCVQNECCLEDEDPNARCGENEVCFEGSCDFVCSADDDCEEGTCCCDDGSCSADCCGEIKLPDTGVGAESGTSGLLGAGVLAAGAAAFAAMKLNRRQSESNES